jgi:hypothetical protein
VGSASRAALFSLAAPPQGIRFAMQKLWDKWALPALSVVLIGVVVYSSFFMKK